MILGMEPKNQNKSKLWPNIFQYIAIYFRKNWFTSRYIKNKIFFINDMQWDIPSLKKMFLSENVIFWGLWRFLGHFGQQAPESQVSELQNGVSTSSLPPFIVDLLTFTDYPRFNSIFHLEF